MFCLVKRVGWVKGDQLQCPKSKFNSAKISLRSMKKILLITIFSFLLFVSPGLSRSIVWQQVDIYYVNWDIETRNLLEPAIVRKQGAKFHSSNQPEVNDFVKLLAVKKLQPEGEPGFPFPENARLVVDLIDAKGAKTTYYASRYKLCNWDCSLKRPINETFRSRFKNLAKKH
jgi:hypothetical protein